MVTARALRTTFRLCSPRRANLIIHIMPLAPFRPFATQMRRSADVPGASGQIQTMLPRLSMATVTLYTHPAYLGLNGTLGMLST